MVGNDGTLLVTPVVNPALRETTRRRLLRMTNEQVAGRRGPLRQVRYRDEAVSPLALERGCCELLRRAQRAVTPWGR